MDRRLEDPSSGKSSGKTTAQKTKPRFNASRPRNQGVDTNSLTPAECEHLFLSPNDIAGRADENRCQTEPQNLGGEEF